MDIKNDPGPSQSSKAPSVEHNPWHESSSRDEQGIIRLPPTADKSSEQISNSAPQKHRAIGLSQTTLLIICYNRPEYLKRTLKSVAAALPEHGGPHVLISQDGDISSVTSVAEQGSLLLNSSPERRGSQISFEHIHHSQTRKPGDDPTGYGALARHFGWALTKAFSRPDTDTVIILEDDLEIAIDFFDYFAAMAVLLRQDETLLAASAYNDMGQRQNVGDPGRALRSDFFPGLGWMLHKRVWEELQPIWPSAYWDDWLREPARRKGESHLLHAGLGQPQACSELACLATCRVLNRSHTSQGDISFTRR